jgi:hypothetical protein
MRCCSIAWKVMSDKLASSANIARKTLTLVAIELGKQN